jgi:hypothetical protein
MITEEIEQKSDDHLKQTPSLGYEKVLGNQSVITTDKLLPTAT